MKPFSRLLNGHVQFVFNWHLVSLCFEQAVKDRFPFLRFDLDRGFTFSKLKSILPNDFAVLKLEVQFQSLHIIEFKSKVTAGIRKFIDL